MTEIYPVGIVKSPYKNQGDAPRQGRNHENEEMIIEIFEEYKNGLGDFKGISHLIILLWFDRADRNRLTDKPPWSKDTKPLFEIRSPNRPNPIGFDIGKIVKISGREITVSGLDALDKTPVIDIKPYVPSIDCIPDATYIREQK